MESESADICVELPASLKCVRISGGLDQTLRLRGKRSQKYRNRNSSKRIRQPSMHPDSLQRNQGHENLIKNPTLIINRFTMSKLDSLHSFDSMLPRHIIKVGLHHHLEALFPGLFPAGSSGLSAGQIILRHGLTHKGLLHVAILGGLSFAKYCETDSVKSIHNILSQCRITAIEYLTLQSRKTMEHESIEANICSMLGLATIPNSSDIDMFRSLQDKGPRQGPFKNLQLLDFFGLTKRHHLYTEGVAMLYDFRSGLGSMTISNIAHMVTYYFLIISTQELSEPKYKMHLLSSSEEYFDLSAESDSFPLQTSELYAFASSFEVLSQWSICGSLIPVIDMIRNYITVLSGFHTGNKPPSWQLSALADFRNLTQHKILSLQRIFPTTAIGIAFKPDDVVYESCRGAIVVFSLLVIFPIPYNTSTFTKAALCIREALLYSNMYWTLETPRLLLWLLTMGGIAAKNTSLRKQFVGALQRVIKKMQLSRWEEMKDVLRGYLWLPVTNDADGLELWQDSVRHPFVCIDSRV